MDSETTDVKKALRWRRWAIGTVGVLLVLLMLLPSLVSVAMRGRIQDRLSSETGLEVSIGSLSLGWFSSINLRDVAVMTPSQQEFLTCGNVATEKSLFGLIFRDKTVGQVRLDSLAANLDLSGTMLDEVKAALGQMDPTRGLLGQIANPNRDALVHFVLTNISLKVRTESEQPWQAVTAGTDLNLTLDREGENVQLTGKVIDAPIELSPVVCDYGLQFIAPVLAGAVDLNGQCKLSISEFSANPPSWNEMDLKGNLMLDAVNAEVHGPLITGVTNAISQISGGGDVPLVVQLADQSDVSFSVDEGMVHHDGLTFGLPKVLPSLVLTSSGDVGLDKTLDFQIDAAIPFDIMGEDPLLQKLGAPTLSVPIAGTFQEPKVELGEGQLLGGLVRDVVRGVTNDNVDPGPLLKKIAESELLKKRDREGDGLNVEEKPDRDGLLSRLRKMQDERNAESSEDATENAEQPVRKGGLLQRLRDRKLNREP